MTETLQILGALLVLAGFAATQLGRLDATSASYLVINVLGAGVLGIVAVLGADWGFVLLEGTWALVSAIALIRISRRREARPMRRADRPA